MPYSDKKSRIKETFHGIMFIFVGIMFMIIGYRKIMLYKKYITFYYNKNKYRLIGSVFFLGLGPLILGIIEFNNFHSKGYDSFVNLGGIFI